MSDIIKDLEAVLELYKQPLKPREYNPISREEYIRLMSQEVKPEIQKEMKLSLQRYFKYIRVGNLVYKGVRK